MNLTFVRSKTMPDVDPAFGHWFSGFVDGEGCFGIYFSTSGRVFLFKIALRADDINILREIHRHLGIGRVQVRHNRSDDNPVGSFIIQSIPEHCGVLIPLLRQYPLRSKKREDFEIFAAATEARMRNINQPLSPSERSELEKSAARLKLVKKFNGGRDANALHEV